MKIVTVARAAAALAAALVLSACGAPSEPAAEPAAAGPTTTGPAAGPSPAQVSTVHNAADVAFVQGMIPHHEQAVRMARSARDRAGSDRVRGLAARIEQAQGPEITRMRGLLAAWTVPERHDMAGMADMGQLDGLRGPAFDRAFLESMIRHHEGAVQMAQTELAQGTNADATALARTISDAQRAEIAEMRTLLG